VSVRLRTDVRFPAPRRILACRPRSSTLAETRAPNRSAQAPSPEVAWPPGLRPSRVTRPVVHEPPSRLCVPPGAKKPCASVGADPGDSSPEDAGVGHMAKEHIQAGTHAVVMTRRGEIPEDDVMGGAYNGVKPEARPAPLQPQDKQGNEPTSARLKSRPTSATDTRREAGRIAARVRHRRTSNLIPSILAASDSVAEPLRVACRFAPLVVSITPASVMM